MSKTIADTAKKQLSLIKKHIFIFMIKKTKTWVPKKNEIKTFHDRFQWLTPFFTFNIFPVSVLVKISYWITNFQECVLHLNPNHLRKVSSIGSCILRCAGQQLTITHHQLWEEVNEVLRGENHRGVQRNYKASPQSQIQICRQLLLTHTNTQVIRNKFTLH